MRAHCTEGDIESDQVLGHFKHQQASISIKGK